MRLPAETGSTTAEGLSRTGSATAEAKDSTKLDEETKKLKAEQMQLSSNR